MLGNRGKGTQGQWSHSKCFGGKWFSDIFVPNLFLLYVMKNKYENQTLGETEPYLIISVCSPLLFHLLAYYTLTPQMYSPVLHCIALQYSALHCTAVYCTALQYTILHCTVLQYIALHTSAPISTAVHCTVQHCTALLYFWHQDLGLCEWLIAHSMQIQ